MIKLIRFVVNAFCELVGWQGAQTPPEAAQTPPPPPPAAVSVPEAVVLDAQTPGKTDTTVQEPVQEPIQIFGPGTWLEYEEGNRAFSKQDPLTGKTDTIIFAAPVHTIKDDGHVRPDGVVARDMTPGEAAGRIAQHQSYVKKTRQKADEEFVKALEDIRIHMTEKAESLLPKYREAHQIEADERNIPLAEVEAEFIKIAVDKSLADAVRLYTGEDKARLLRIAFERFFGPPRTSATVVDAAVNQDQGKA